MKILELTNYSAGICGVWTRVREESIRLAKRGHEVRIFSSDFTKGSNKLAKKEDRINNVKIMRFPGKILGGEGFMKWNFEKKALNFEPEVIITHSYRLPHTLKALEVAKTLKERGKKCRVFLVAHAPFERNSTRSFIAKIVVWIYDNFIGLKTLNKFDKIFAITHWEMPYLIKYGAKKNKIEYVPNGIPEEFFSQKEEKEQNKILFLGRISPIKNLETMISALSLIKDKKIIFEIVGPAEENYLKELKRLAKEKNVEKRIIFSPAIYNLKEKIKKIDSANIFILPSKSEGMPQGLIEAMARGKIVIASDNLAAKDLITDKKIGYLFKIGDFKELAKKINFILENKIKNKAIKKEARKYVEQFSWKKIIEKIENLIREKNKS
ncbi:MAG: glycosyltransferase family 4 protein [archaeon]|nr:glycosyltransferase family 4 protein [archaeon]